MKSINDHQRPDAAKVEKLPRWAKSYVELLEMRLAEQEHLVDTASGEGVDYSDMDVSKMYIQVTGDDLCREVPVRSRVRLPLGDGRVAEVRVDRRGRGGIEVMVSRGTIAITPQVSNVVQIMGIDR